MATPLTREVRADERNPFRGKGLAVTLAMLLEPRREWTLAELALRAQVSRPLVTKVVERLRREQLVVGEVHQGRRAAVRPTSALFTATAERWPRPALWIHGHNVPTDLPLGGGGPISAALAIPWEAPPRVYVRSRAMIPEVLLRYGGHAVSEPVGEWGIAIVDFPLEPGPLPPLVAALELGDTVRGWMTLEDHFHAIRGSFADEDDAAMTAATRPPVTIEVPANVAETLARLTDAVGPDVVLVGGWAVTCRLKMARKPFRITEDVDVILRRDARPARVALEAMRAAQTDAAHPCRLSGLPVVVDLLADGSGPETIEDPDGLRLLVPPFAELLARTARPVRLVDPEESIEAVVGLPLAGALLAAKAANLALDFRDRGKRAADSSDALLLIAAFGMLALLNDLVHAGPVERHELRRLLELLGPGGLAGPSRDLGYIANSAEYSATVDGLIKGLA